MALFVMLIHTIESLNRKIEILKLSLFFGPFFRGNSL